MASSRRRGAALGAVVCFALVALAGCLGAVDDGANTTSNDTDDDPTGPIIDPSPAFGAEGRPTFSVHTVPGGLSTTEPTIGIPWTTDSVFYHSGSTTMRGVFDADGNATWTDVTPPYQVPINVDPMLHADPDTGRVWAGGLHGGCSVMMHTDDDGESWLPAGNMCSGKDFDHQSIGSGPSNAPGAGLLYPHTQYYCGQFGTISCAASHDGGQTWGPPVTEQTVCGGFHGHIRVSRVSGMMAVPVPDCGDELGMLTTYDGLTYVAKTIPDSEEWTNGFDPSLQFGRGEGWLWYGHASEHGIHIALSKDDGDTWEPLGAGMDAVVGGNGNGNGNGTHYLDVGQFHDPPVVAGTFADVQVGDDDRVAFSFMGLEDDGAANRSLLNSDQIYACNHDQQAELVWHYYVATTLDGGDTWTVQRISEDPVQVGGVYDSVVDNSTSSCRNLLDFNDMDIDSTGRVHIAFADGCVDECATTAEPDSDGYRARVLKLYRQETGPGLFAEADGGGAASDDAGT